MPGSSGHVVPLAVAYCVMPLDGHRTRRHPAAVRCDFVTGCAASTITVTMETIMTTPKNARDRQTTVVTSGRGVACRHPLGRRPHRTVALPSLSNPLAESHG